MSRLLSLASVVLSRSRILPAVLSIIASSGIAASSLNIRAADGETGPRLGLQSWTCRNMTFEQVVEFARKHHLRYVQFTGGHLKLSDSPGEVARKAAILKAAGIVPYTIGVMATLPDKEANRPLFEYARAWGLQMIVVEPQLDAWDVLEELVKEYDIKLAIHNHGRTPGSIYGDPEVVKGVLAERDARIGVCLDVGWITAAGFDAASVFKDYGGRVFDMHFKDKKRHEVGDTIAWMDTRLGEGDTDYDALFAAIKETGWSGVMAIETDSLTFAADPNPLVEHCIQFFMSHAGTVTTGASSP